MDRTRIQEPTTTSRIVSGFAVALLCCNIGASQESGDASRVKPPPPPKVSVTSYEPHRNQVDYGKGKTKRPVPGRGFEEYRGVVQRTRSRRRSKTIDHYYYTQDRQRRDGSWTLKKVLHGPYQEYWDGVLQINGYYREGKKTSLWTRYDRKGNRTRETIYIEGRREGVQRTWRSDGLLMFVTRYRGDKKHGLRQQYSDVRGRDGKKYAVLVQEGNWRDNSKHGRTRAWWVNHDTLPPSQGHLSFEGDYRDGELVARQRWNSYGKPLRSTTRGR